MCYEQLTNLLDMYGEHTASELLFTCYEQLADMCGEHHPPASFVLLRVLTVFTTLPPLTMFVFVLEMRTLPPLLSLSDPDPYEPLDPIQLFIAFLSGFMLLVFWGPEEYGPCPESPWRSWE